MLLDAQHLIDAHESEGFVFDEDGSTENWYLFERYRDDFHCAHGVINEGNSFVFGVAVWILSTVGMSILTHWFMQGFEK